MDLSDPKVKRRILVLGESAARELYVSSIGASSEIDGLIGMIDQLCVMVEDRDQQISSMVGNRGD